MTHTNLVNGEHIEHGAPSQPHDLEDKSPDIIMARIGAQARRAAAILASAPAAAKNRALNAAAEALRDELPKIIQENQKDIEGAANLRASLIDRLALDEARIGAMASGLCDLVSLPDPIGAIMAEWDRPNGLAIARVRVPLGVIGIIYESRPNVTADAGALCLKSGNAAILRGGSESFHSSTAIVDCLRQGLGQAGLPKDAIQLVPTRDRAAVGAMLRLTDSIDVIVPRGGPSLIRRVSQESRIPVIKHLDGIVHVYLHASAEVGMARDVVLNSKMRRTSVCGAAETLLVDRAGAHRLLPAVLDALAEAGCELRGDAETAALDPRVLPADEQDWAAEYLDSILSIRQVDGVDEAMAHIARYGSHHTDCIVAEDPDAARRFLAGVDSAIVLHNASTQFADGAQFGMGAEIGISTGKLHARGPVGAEQLTSYKYVVRGAGQTRP